jgi:hypothetical protein
MEITLKTTFYAIQALLLELKDLKKPTDKPEIKDSAEDQLMIVNIENALEELETVYTAFIQEQNISNYPSFEKLKNTILD